MNVSIPINATSSPEPLVRGDEYRSARVDAVVLKIERRVGELEYGTVQVLGLVVVLRGDLSCLSLSVLVFEPEASENIEVVRIE